MIIFIISFIGVFAITIYFLNKKQELEVEALRQERAIDGNFRAENSSKIISSILTGVPIQVRYGDGGLTAAGMQQMQWCTMILANMGKRKSMIVNIMGRKVKITRTQVEAQFNSI